jgi:hypothetical protein
MHTALNWADNEAQFAAKSRETLDSPQKEVNNGPNCYQMYTVSGILWRTVECGSKCSQLFTIHATLENLNG